MEAADALLLAGETVWAGARDAVWRLSAAGARALERQDCGGTISFVPALLRDPAGALWIGHDNGLTRLDGQGCRTLTTADGRPNNEAACMLQTPDGALWPETPAGVVRVNAEALAHIGM